MTEQPMGEVLLYRRDDGSPALEVRLEDDSLWLSQQQIAELFQTSQQNVSLHLKNIYDEGELTEEGTHKDILLVRDEGKRKVQRLVAHYNLDAIISVGYRVKSTLATQFRIWATERLREYLVKGFTMDDDRLKVFGAAEFRAQNHEPTYMKDWLAHLDRLIAAMDAPMLQGAGNISHAQAVTHARAQYDTYRSHLDETPSDVETAYLEAIKQAQHEIESRT